MFTLALAREAETERVRVEALRLAEVQARQAHEAVLRGRIANIRGYALRGIGKDAEEIVRLLRGAGIPQAVDFGDLLEEATQAHCEATDQLQAMLDARVLADQVAAAARLREQEAAAERQREADAAIERQRQADAEHAARSQELKRQQDAFEVEKVEAKRLQDKKDAAAKAERQALEAKLAALQPKPAPVPVEKSEAAVLALTKVAEMPAPQWPAAEVKAPQAFPAKPARPSDAAIVTVLAETFDVHNETVIDWLRGFDADAVQQALNYEEIPA